MTAGCPNRQRRGDSGVHDGRGSLGVSAVELVADRSQLAAFEFGHAQAAPAFGRADQSLAACYLALLVSVPQAICLPQKLRSPDGALVLTTSMIALYRYGYLGVVFGWAIAAILLVGLVAWAYIARLTQRCDW
jgi:hypothetical protein